MDYSATKTEAEQRFEILKGQVLEGRQPMSLAGDVRFDDLAADLRREYEAKGRRSGDTLKWRLNNLAHYFGGRRAASITTADVNGYIAKRRAHGASGGTIRAELGKLKRMFNLAIQSERLAHKPYIPLPREGNPRQGFFELDQFQAVLAGLPD